MPASIGFINTALRAGIIPAIIPAIIKMIKELFVSIGVPIRLRDLSVRKADFDWIVANTKGGSVNSNPRTPDPISLRELLENAW